MEGRAMVKNVYVDEFSLPSRLMRLGTGGCTCMTKTPELLHHSRGCTYRVVEEARILLGELRDEITILGGNLETSRANEGAWEASANSYKEEAGNLQLVAGRYQYQFEEAMRCINSIDDLFEYAYKEMDVKVLQQMVREYLAKFTKAVSSVKK